MLKLLLAMCRQLTVAGAVALPVLFVAPQEAIASNVQFVGNVSYTATGNFAVLRADRVQNFDSFGYSGTLQMELWAFPTRFNGTYQIGYKLAQHSLGQLNAGYY